MNRRLMTILFVALAVATVASYVVYRAVRTRIATSKGGATSRVIVAKRNLDLGTVIKDVDVGVGEWVGGLPKGMITRAEDAIGRGVVSTLNAGEPIFENRLARTGAGGGLAATIPPGMRACAVKVNDVVGVAGFLGPGMRVDVIITGNPPGATGTEGSKVKTILQNVEVLSAGQNIQKDAEGRPVQVQVVNLLVSPDQAEILSLASNETRIQLVLRNPLDTEVAATAGSSMSGLFSGPKAPASAQPPAPKPRKTVAAVKPPAPPLAVAPARLAPGQYLIEVINGPRKDQAKFAKPEDARQPEEVKQ